MSASQLWTLPVASRALLGAGPWFENRLGREVAIRFRYEGDERDLHAALVFEGVEALRVTYMTSPERSKLVAYDGLVDRGDTEWLAAAKAALEATGAQDRALRHLMVYFDDGPCYEVICHSFREDDDLEIKRRARTKKNIVAMARRILAKDVDPLEGCRWIVRSQGPLSETEREDLDLLTLVAIDSETAHFAMEPVRRHWNAAALSDQDRERAAFVTRWEKELMDACRALTEKFDPRW